MIDYIQTAAGREHMIAVLKRWVPIEYHWMLVELTKPLESDPMKSAQQRQTISTNL